MLRVSINEESSAATLKVEGKVVGPWALELGRAWEGLWTRASQKPLKLDLCEVSFVDQEGVRILRQIVKTARAEVFANSPLTRHFAAQALRDSVPEI